MSKEKAPAFPFYASDYLADIKVQMMTIEDEGCYTRLLAYCWREGSLPNDRDSLKALCKGTPISDLVLGCFREIHHGSNSGSYLVHPRLEKERENRKVFIESQKEKGRISGIARRNKALSAEPGFARVRTQSNSSSSSSSSSSNIKDPPIIPPGGSGSSNSDRRCTGWAAVGADYNFQEDSAYAGATERNARAWVAKHRD